ncbi:MAG: DUF348 domain-containing protein [Firmicutes bacterium]|nr:DUF348 domain-containing protein [Bacillota bacterium]
MFYWVVFFKNLMQSLRSNKSVAVLAGLLLLTVAPTVSLSLDAKIVELEVDGQLISTTTNKQTVGQLLAETGVGLGDHDYTEPEIDQPLEDGQMIKVMRSFPVRIIADQNEREVYVGRLTVGEVLDTAGVTLGGLDRTEPAQWTLVKPNDSVRVYRVSEKIEEIKHDTPAPVERTVDTSLERGIARTVQKGAPGVVKESVKVVLEDGQEIYRETVSRQVVKEPVKRVIAEGTLTSVSRGGERINFDRAMEVVATAYSFSAGSRTSTGEPARVGGVAVDPSVIPYGTRMYIENYGYATAIDCGGAIKGNRIDVFLETDKECNKWGVKRLKIFILS